MRVEAFAYLFLAVPLLAWAAWLSRKSYAQLAPPARWTSLILRSVILIGLVAALARPSVLSRINHNHVIFLLDTSQSVNIENLEAALKDIDATASEAVRADGDSRISLIAFGKKPEFLIRSQTGWSGIPPEVAEKACYVKALPEMYTRRTQLIAAASPESRQELEELGRRIANLEKFRDERIGDETDVESALTLGLNCGMSGERRTLYLMTDGHFNRGRWSKALVDVDERSFRLHVVRLNKPSPPEVAATDLFLPSSVRVNQGFTAELRLAANVATQAQLTVYKDGVVVDDRPIEVKVGETTLRLPGLYFRDKGFHRIEAAIRPAVDTQLQNNTVHSITVVPGEAKVLYVDGDEDQMPYLKTALELEGMQVDARPATGIPQSLSDLLSYDAFILSNVPADRLSHPQMRMIRTYVREFGGGFLMLGGEQSFGLGGYYGTPVEDILPVKMPIQKDMTRPSLAIALVIDKSGSMSGVKIELARRAAVATAEAVNPRDQIGVIGFDSESRVLLDLTPAGDRGTISSAIANLEAGGGTFLYPALEDAHQRLLESNARKKHVIVLTDGQTQGFGYEELVGAMSADGITLSSVGIGDDADMRLMENIASAGGGRAYFTSDYYSIPQIFTREALRASNSMLVEQLVQPVVVGEDTCLLEIDTDEMPLLSGYVATTARPAATLIIASESGDPILAKWRYGLGRTAAYTSETKPRWAEDWIAWEDFARFWSQLVRSITGDNVRSEVFIEASHRIEGVETILTADLRGATGDFVTGGILELTGIDATGKAQSLDVQHVGPGLYEAKAGPAAYGKEQQFVWRLKQDDRHCQPAAYGTVQSYSPEFRVLGSAEPEFERLSARNLGAVMNVGETHLSLSKEAPATWIPVFPYLLAICLLLAPLDILVRRLG